MSQKVTKFIFRNSNIITYNNLSNLKKSYQDFLVDHYQNLIPITTKYLNARADFQDYLKNRKIKIKQKD